jgi:hypothetical protein
MKFAGELWWKKRNVVGFKLPIRGDAIYLTNTIGPTIENNNLTLPAISFLHVLNSSWQKSTQLFAAESPDPKSSCPDAPLSGTHYVN